MSRSICAGNTTENKGVSINPINEVKRSKAHPHFHRKRIKNFFRTKPYGGMGMVSAENASEITILVLV